MKNRFTEEQLEQLLTAGKIRGFEMKERSGPVLPIINLKGKLRSKFGNNKVMVDDIEFDSEKEARRYQELKLKIIAGKIGWLELQVPYRFKIESKENGDVVKISAYVADFRYVDSETSETIIEDVKSEATRKLRPYRMKKKLMKAIYGITIQEI